MHLVFEYRHLPRLVLLHRCDGAFPELDAPLPSHTALNQPLRRRINISYLLVLDERLQCAHNLRAFVWHIAQLGFREKRMEDAEICMP